MNPCMLLTVALANIVSAQLLGFPYFNGSANVPAEYHTPPDFAPGKRFRPNPSRQS